MERESSFYNSFKGLRLRAMIGPMTAVDAPVAPLPPGPLPLAQRGPLQGRQLGPPLKDTSAPWARQKPLFDSGAGTVWKALWRLYQKDFLSNLSEVKRSSSLGHSEMILAIV